MTATMTPANYDMVVYSPANLDGTQPQRVHGVKAIIKQNTHRETFHAEKCNPNDVEVVLYEVEGAEADDDFLFKHDRDRQADIRHLCRDAWETALIKAARADHDNPDLESAPVYRHMTIPDLRITHRKSPYVWHRPRWYRQKWTRQALAAVESTPVNRDNGNGPGSAAAKRLARQYA